MTISSQILEERDGRTLALVTITKPGADPHDVYELTHDFCGASIAQLDHEDDARAAWGDPCPTCDQSEAP